MKLGAERKKVAIFVALILVAGIVYWINSPSEGPAPTATARPAADPAVAALGGPPAGEAFGKVKQKRIVSGKGSLSEKIFTSPDAVDPGKVDPTLRLDLLAKVQAVDVEGGTRNLFQYCTDCAQKEAAAKAAKDAEEAKAKIPLVSKIMVNGKEVNPGDPDPPRAVVATPPPPPPPPSAQPINLKYYGYSTKFSDGEKKAFFLDGEDVIVAAEGEIIKKQYKVVRISNNSVQMEDTGSKSRQTLPIQPDAPV